MVPYHSIESSGFKTVVNTLRLSSSEHASEYVKRRERQNYQQLQMLLATLFVEKALSR